MHSLGTEVTDPELAVLLDPGGRSVSVRLAGNPERLVGQPLGFPLWFVGLCVLLPLVLMHVYVAHRAARQGLMPSEVVWLALGYFAGPAIIGMFGWKNWKMVRRGDFFVLDKARRTLTLPRRGLELRDIDIRGFVEVRAWYAEFDSEGASFEWLGELSVMVRTGEGLVARYPVLACQRTGKVGEVAEIFAEFFGVGRQLIRPR